MNTVSRQIYLPCISMWQPWASWVAWGWKTIETRTHLRFRSLVGQRIGIHAAQRFDDRARHVANHYLSDGQARSAGRSDPAANSPFAYQRGIICTVFVRDFRLLTPKDASSALIECDTTRYGLFLEAIHRIEPPLQCKGRQGIWREICPASVYGSYVTCISSPNPVSVKPEKKEEE